MRSAREMSSSASSRNARDSVTLASVAARCNSSKKAPSAVPSTPVSLGIFFFSTACPCHGSVAHSVVVARSASLAALTRGQERMFFWLDCEPSTPSTARSQPFSVTRWVCMLSSIAPSRLAEAPSSLTSRQATLPVRKAT